MDHRIVSFVVAVLYGLEEKWRGIGASDSFERLLSSDGGLHLAWESLREGGFLGEFAPHFEFDPLYGRTNLGKVLSVAVRDLLIRQDGTRFAYHLDALEAEEADKIARAAGIPHTLVERARNELNRLLAARKTARPLDLA